MVNLLFKKFQNLPLTKSERALLRLIEMCVVAGVMAGLSALTLAITDLANGPVTQQDVRYAAIFVAGSGGAGVLGALLKFLPASQTPFAPVAPLAAPFIQQAEAAATAAATAARHSLEQNDVVTPTTAAPPAVVPHG